MKNSFHTLVAAAITVLLIGPCYSQQTRQERGGEAGALKAGYRGINLTFDGDRVFYISPNDLVDIIAVINTGTGASGKPRPGVSAGTMMKMKRVMAVETSRTDQKSVVRLEVNPNEAQYLEAAAVSGSLWLSLRKKEDIEDAPMEFSTWNKLLKAEYKAVESARSFPQDDQNSTMTGNRARSTSGQPGAAALEAIKGRIPEGRPALSLPISSDKVMLVQAGDNIDVLASIAVAGPDGVEKHKITLTLLQNIPVLDVRRSAARAGRSILLLGLNFKELQEAALAWDTADVQVVVRGRYDTEKHAIQPADLDRFWHP